MIKITPHLKELKVFRTRSISALIKYLDNKYLGNHTIVRTPSYVFYNQVQFKALKKAAQVEYDLWETNKPAKKVYSDVLGKPQVFVKQALLAFANSIELTLEIHYFTKKPSKVSKERLQFMYVDCINKLFELVNQSAIKGSTARKINHYRQLLANNRDTWDYLSVRTGFCSGEFNADNKYKYLLSHGTLYLDPDLSIKQLVGKAKQIIKPDKSPWTTQPPIPERSVQWELEKYAKHKAAKQEAISVSNQYKITITDEATGDVMQEFYLPKS
jgi:hypothetical protein